MNQFLKFPSDHRYIKPLTKFIFNVESTVIIKKKIINMHQPTQLQNVSTLSNLLQTF